MIAVIERFEPHRKVALVGHSMGAHTAFLVAAARPDLVDRLVMLEGHAAGSDNPGEADAVGDFFASWPSAFADESEARRFLPNSALSEAWIDDLEPSAGGLRARFDPEVMRRTLAAVHEPRWHEWEKLAVPTLVVFAEHGMFGLAQRDELIRRRPETRKAFIPGAGHDAHLEAFDLWVATLRGYLDHGHPL